LLTDESGHVLTTGERNSTFNQGSIARHAGEAAVSQRPPGPALTVGDIAEYLETADDFAFEREVYHVAPWIAIRGGARGALQRPGHGKDKRQFDVRASYTLQDNRIALAIECKGLTADYPSAHILCAAGAHSGGTP